MFVVPVLFVVGATLIQPKELPCTKPSRDLWGHQANSESTASNQTTQIQLASVESNSQVFNWTEIGPPGGDVEVVRISPENPNLLFAGIAPGGASGGTLFRSNDGGMLWEELPEFHGNSVYDIQFGPAGLVFVGSTRGVWRSQDNGNSWEDLDLGITGGTVGGETVFRLALQDVEGELHLFAGISSHLGSQSKNLLMSIDGGTSWVNITPPLAFPLACQGITFHPLNAGKIYACFGNSFSGGQIWYSPDYGMNWFNRSQLLPNTPMYGLAHDGESLYVCGGANFGGGFGLFRSDDDGQSWSALHDNFWPSYSIQDIAIDAQDTNVIYLASEHHGLFKSTDRGESWSFGIGNSLNMSLKSVAIDPYDNSHLFVSASSLAVWTSNDAGESWTSSSQGIDYLNIYSVASNPNNADEIAIAFQGLNNGGVYTSDDRGIGWTLEALPPTRYNAVSYSPEGILYAISDGPTSIAPEGIYRKEDSGVWSSMGPNQGPFFESELFTFEFRAMPAGSLLVGGSDFGVAGTEATIWFFDAEFQQWEKVFEGSQSSEVIRDLEMVGEGESTRFLATKGVFNLQTQQGEVLISLDSGHHWTQSMNGLPASLQPNTLAVCVEEPNTVFLGVSDSLQGNYGLFRSSDGGENWWGVGETTPVLQVLQNPEHAGLLYVLRSEFPWVEISVDGGESFYPMSLGLSVDNSQLRELRFINSSTPYLFLATDQGGFGIELNDGVAFADCNENLNPDPQDIAVGFSLDCNRNEIPDECEASEPFGIISSNIPNNAIDARQPFGVNGGNPQGWQWVKIGFNANISELQASDFEILQVGGTNPKPNIVGFFPLPQNQITIFLDRIIAPGAWTSVRHICSGSSIRLGYLPGDANGDGTSAPIDILALINSLNGVIPLPIWSTDINRSEVAEPSDILRLVDLLNGAGEYDPYFGVTLP